MFLFVFIITVNSINKKNNRESMADLSQIIVLFVCVMAFVLLTIACAGNSWVVAYDDSISFGLWKYCITGTFNSECLPISKLRKTDSWHDGARAMSVISILVAAFTSLACLARIFLEDNEIIKKVGNPNVSAGLLVLAGNIIIKDLFSLVSIWYLPPQRLVYIFEN